MLDNERFYSTILNLKVGDQAQAAILKDVQRHPFKNAIVHVDFQRVEENEKIRISIPLHFTGAAVSPGVKSQGGIVSHMRTETEVSCLPKDLPEFIEVDISGLSLNESIHLSQLKIPQGVTLVDLARMTRRSWPFTARVRKSRNRLRWRRRVLRRQRVRQRRRGLHRRRRRAAGMRRRRPNLRRKRKPRRNRPRKTPRNNCRRFGSGAVGRTALIFYKAQSAVMSGLPLRIIVGLGNPGPEHLVTRHNAGFWFVDLLARRHGGEFRDYRKYSGETARITLERAGHRSIEAYDLYESQRPVGAPAERVLQDRAGGYPGGAR